MFKKESNEQARKIYEEWQFKKREIEENAKRDGTWKTVGLDVNNRLFKDVDTEVKQKLQELTAKRCCEFVVKN